MSSQIKTYLEKLHKRPDLLAKIALYAAKRREDKLKDERSIKALRACESGTVTPLIANSAYIALDFYAAYNDDASAAYHAARAAWFAAHTACFAAYDAHFAYCVVYNAIRAADNREAEEQFISEKIKQSFANGGWIE